METQTINQSKIRVGNFTSSEIVALTKNGKAKDSLGAPAYTYIEECNFERKLGRSLDTESNARPLSWGKLVEGRLFELLGLEYKLVSQESIQHPTISYWAGSPDAQKFESNDSSETVVEIKCPITLKSFCQLVEPIYKCLIGLEAINYIRAEHKEGEKYYWQIVSNAILTNSRFAELIIYCPYKSELLEIQEKAAPSSDSPDSANWIYYASHDELPWIPDGGYYKNINVIRFDVPEEDKQFLTKRIIECGSLLIQPC